MKRKDICKDVEKRFNICTITRNPNAKEQRAVARNIKLMRQLGLLYSSHTQVEKEFDL
jgi:hypothetical protein